jgi:hypothetical protein
MRNFTRVMPKATDTPLTPDITSAITDTLIFAGKNDPPKRPLQAVISSLRDQEKSIRAALDREWTPTQLAVKLRTAGVKVSEARLTAAIREIAGVSSKTKKGRA